MLFTQYDLRSFLDDYVTSPAAKDPTSDAVLSSEQVGADITSTSTHVVSSTHVHTDADTESEKSRSEGDSEAGSDEETDEATHTQDRKKGKGKKRGPSFFNKYEWIHDKDYGKNQYYRCRYREQDDCTARLIVRT